MIMVQNLFWNKILVFAMYIMLMDMENFRRILHLTGNALTADGLLVNYTVVSENGTFKEKLLSVQSVDSGLTGRSRKQKKSADMRKNASVSVKNGRRKTVADWIT